MSKHYAKVTDVSEENHVDRVYSDAMEPADTVNDKLIKDNAGRHPLTDDGQGNLIHYNFIKKVDGFHGFKKYKITGSGPVFVMTERTDTEIQATTEYTDKQTEFDADPPKEGNFLSGTDSPTVNDDEANTSGNGVFGKKSLFYDATNNQWHICNDPTATAAQWNQMTNVGGGSSPTLVSISRELAIGSTMARYEDFLFLGTNVHTISAIKVILAYSGPNTDTFKVHVIDKSHDDAVICSDLAMSVAVSATDEIFDLGAISNLTTGEAILEVQADAVNAGKNITIKSVLVKF